LRQHLTRQDKLRGPVNNNILDTLAGVAIQRPQFFSDGLFCIVPYDWTGPPRASAVIDSSTFPPTSRCTGGCQAQGLGLLDADAKLASETRQPRSTAELLADRSEQCT
jgi:hypothetical protein